MRSRFGNGVMALVVAAGLLIGTVPALADTWTIVYGDPGPSNFSSAEAVVVAPDGSIYVLGTFFGQFADLVAVDGFDVFLMKLGTDGSVVWVKAWDPASMDGTDYSGPLDWKHFANRGEVFVDGAGNIGFTIADFVAFVDPDGDLIASSDGSGAVAGLHGITQARPQPDGDGGAVLGVSDALGVAAVSSTLTVEWSAPSLEGFNGQVMALPDGGAIRVFDRMPEFSFQPVTQAVTRIGADGTTQWSILHNSRCSGAGPPSAGDYAGDVAVVIGESTVTVSSRAEFSDTCTEGVQFMASYSLETGELVADLSFDNVVAEQAHACSTSSTVAAGWVGGNTGVCPDTSPWRWDATEVYPRLGSQGESEYFGVVHVAISNGQGDSFGTLGLARFNEAAGVIHLDTVRRIANDDSVSVHDVAVTPDGEVVFVGRAQDGSAILPTGGQHQRAETEPEGNPHAYVAFNPSTAPPPPPPPDSFADDNGSVFEADIEWLAAMGVTKGCNPPTNNMFCPNDPVTRGQMAAFLHRALGGSITPSGDPIDFTDTGTSTFAADIDWLSSAKITAGCNPPTNDEFCPSSPVTRGQMAAFLVRALGYSDDGGGNLFTDDNGSIFEGQIDRLATAGVTRGCNPPTNDHFCPSSNVTRAQMAAFLHRALD